MVTELSLPCDLFGLELGCAYSCLYKVATVLSLLGVGEAKKTVLLFGCVRF